MIAVLARAGAELGLAEPRAGARAADGVFQGLGGDEADRGGDGEADFLAVAVWDRQAEVCAEFLGKGSRVAVDGRLRSRSWQEEGKRRSAVGVVARRVEFLGGPRSDDGAEVIPFAPAATAG